TVDVSADQVSFVSRLLAFLIAAATCDVSSLSLTTLFRSDGLRIRYFRPDLHRIAADPVRRPHGASCFGDPAGRLTGNLGGRQSGPGRRTLRPDSPGHDGR